MRNKLKVLALKEDLQHARGLATNLRSHGHVVSVAITPTMALRQLLEEEYDVIISGLDFAECSAFDFLRTIKVTNALRNKPFVLCSIRSATRTAETLNIAAQRSGADYVLLLEGCDDPRLGVILDEIQQRINPTAQQR